ncbi:hypothetical protein VTJ83DRAFT_6152 [Remersonia thermophila]|uniref:Secreted protein n=1 Tax=Remersonia thermophila TaxID=72144 RepID=A0ABR4D8V0_9PEZI
MCILRTGSVLWRHRLPRFIFVSSCVIGLDVKYLATVYCGRVFCPSFLSAPDGLAVGAGESPCSTTCHHEPVCLSLAGPSWQ